MLIMSCITVGNLPFDFTEEQLIEVSHEIPDQTRSLSQ